MMTAKDAIQNSMDTAHMVLTTYLSDLSDADLMTRPAATANHLAWQLGHLISAQNQMINSVCPGACPPLPAGFAEQHDKGTTGLHDPSKFLTKARYLELFAQQHQATKKALETLPDADLDKPGPKHLERICPTVGTLFLLVGSHVMMHAGQFATVRRVLGKPVLI